MDGGACLSTLRSQPLLAGGGGTPCACAPAEGRTLWLTDAMRTSPHIRCLVGKLVDELTRQRLPCCGGSSQLQVRVGREREELRVTFLGGRRRG